jgi:hypothetical protein
MTSDDDIDPREDARNAIPEWAKEKYKNLRAAGERDLDPDSPFFIGREGLPDPSGRCIVFPGAEPPFVTFETGADLQAVKIERAFQVHSVMPPKNRWVKLLGEYPEKPPGTVWRDKLDGGPGFFTPEGHGVSKIVRLGVVRRGDSTIYTIPFSGMGTNVFDRFFEKAHLV